MNGLRRRKTSKKKAKSSHTRKRVWATQVGIRISRKKYKDARNSARKIACQADFMRGFEFRARN